MKEEKIAVVCKGFKYKDSSLESVFNSHPRAGYLYKAIISKDGSLKVILPSDQKSMFGIMFDSFAGETTEYKYDFMMYNAESTFYLAPETLNYNSFKEVRDFVDGKTDSSKYEDIVEDDFSEVTTENMTLEEVINHDGIFAGYSESLLSILRAYSKEILGGVMYSVEYVVDRLPAALKTPENKMQIIEELIGSLKSLQDNEDSVDFTEFCILFFSLINKINKGL